jgi:hypothetical protein
MAVTRAAVETARDALKKAEEEILGTLAKYGLEDGEIARVGLYRVEVERKAKLQIRALVATRDTEGGEPNEQTPDRAGAGGDRSPGALGPGPGRELEQLESDA